MSFQRLESKEEKKVLDYCTLHDIPSHKPKTRGWADRWFILPKGVLIVIEMKRCSQWPNRLQWYYLRKLLKKGHNVYVCDNATNAIAILEAAQLPESRDQKDDLASLRRDAFGPWPWED